MSPRSPNAAIIADLEASSVVRRFVGTTARHDANLAEVTP